MNEIIKELYNKSLEKYTYSDCDGDNNHGIRLNEEKFAELIVKECVAEAKDDCAGWAERDRCLVMQVMDRIMKHFGIE